MRRQYYWEHREKCLEQRKQRYQEHREAERAAGRRYYQEHKEECLAHQYQYYQEHPEKRQEMSRRYRVKLKRAVLSHYSGGTLRCARCGFDSNTNGLTIDHIEGGGAAHLRALKIYGADFYRWLRQNNYPDGFQVLCGTCQLIKRIEEGK